LTVSSPYGCSVRIPLFRATREGSSRIGKDRGDSALFLQKTLPKGMGE